MAVESPNGDRVMVAKIPRFRTVQEMREFWDTHDSAEYFEDMKDDGAEVEFNRDAGVLVSPLGEDRARSPREMVLEESIPDIDELIESGDVDGLINELRGVSWRMRAAVALGEIGDPRAVEPLIAALGDENLNVRIDAAKALGKIGDPRAVEPLIAALGDENLNVRIDAAEALSKIGVPAVAHLIVALGNEDQRVRSGAAKALGKIGDPRAVEPLIAALEDEDFWVRQSVIVALGSVSDERAVEPLIIALQAKYWGHRDWVAAEVLGEIGDPRAVEPLIATLQDGDQYECQSAIIALGKIGDPRAFEPLIATLQYDAARDWVAAEALGKIGDPRAVSAIEKAISDSGYVVSDRAKEALGKIKSSEAYKEYLKSSAFIFSIESDIAELKSTGVILHEAEELLKQAKAELNKNNFEEANESANKAKGVAYERKAVYDHDLTFRSISEAEAILAEIRTRGVTIPDEPLTQARHAFDQGNYEEAIGYAKQSEETAKKTQEESKPEITLKFPEETFKPNTWKRIEITITNTGSIHAKKIKIKPSSDIEFRRIPTIPQIDANETKTMIIGMKPMVMGDVPIDIAITFNDVLDREYTSSEEMWLLVAESMSMSESISINEFSPRQAQSEHKYQVALSFAGEDRENAERLAGLLKEKDIRVFYDKYEQADLWGKDLYQHLQSVYRDKAHYCVVFLSQAYAQKLWTRHELESAQARAFREHREYILPVKIDDTEIPGINETIGYIDLRSTSLEEIADMLVKKLSSQNPK
jgi:HEAT repeat protein